MGLFTRLVNSIGDPHPAFASAVATQAQFYVIGKELYPERDPNAWLAHGLSVRKDWRGDFFVQLVTAAPFSILPDDSCGEALAIFAHLGWFLSQFPQAQTKGLPRAALAVVQTYQARYHQLMDPVLTLCGSADIRERWRRRNPWTATNFPQVEERICELVHL